MKFINSLLILKRVFPADLSKMTLALYSGYQEHMSKLKRFFTQLNKRYKTLEEEIDLKNFLQPHVFDVVLEKVPFPYVVIDNFFNHKFYNEMVSYYQDVYAKGLAKESGDNTRFAPFSKKINYDGYLYSLPLTQEFPVGLFFSLTWNSFFSKLFHKPTTFATNIALHYHPANDKTGWVHNDYTTFDFPHTNVLPNGVSASRGETGEFKLSPSELLSADFRQKRAIAILYYFNNEEWKDGDGGETGLYKTMEGASLFLKVAPKNNRLLVFEITPESYHAFQENLKDRNSIVQWFHTDLDWTEKRYGFL